MHSDEGWVFIAVCAVIGLIGGSLIAWALALSNF